MFRITVSARLEPVMLHRLVFVASTLLVLLVAPGVASAITPERYLRDKQSELVQLSRRNASDGEIARVVDSLLDGEAMAKDSLRGSWNTHTPEQRRKFQALFRRLIVDIYRRNFSEFTTLNVHAGVVTPDGVAVRTDATRGGTWNGVVSITYVMNKKHGKWRVRDVVMNGASLVGNYRAAFTATLRKNSFDTLLRRMKTKAAKEGI